MKYPTTKSKNPVTILRTVAKAILEEPKRYYQEDYLIAKDSYPEWRSKRRFPSCGTIACVAGWTCLVTKEKGLQPHHVHTIAQRLLRLTDNEAYVLFGGEALWNSPHSVGTKAYAKAGIAHIRRFVKEKWGKEL